MTAVSHLLLGLWHPHVHLHLHLEVLKRADRSEISPAVDVVDLVWMKGQGSPSIAPQNSL